MMLGRSSIRRIRGEPVQRKEEQVSETIVYVDRSDIKEGRLDELKTAIVALASFIQEHNPRILEYGIFIEEETGRMTVSGSIPMLRHWNATSRSGGRSSARSRI